MIKKYLFIFLVVLFAATSVFYTIEAVTSGAEVAALEKVNDGLVRQESALQDSFVKTLSLASLREKSVELGFTKPASTIYVLTSEPVAALR